MSNETARLEPMTAAARRNATYAGVSADERRAERRARLIRAAVGLYGERGFSSVGVKAVCVEAGLSERYFYESFADRDALLVAAIEAVAAWLFGQLDAAAARGATPRERVRLALTAYFELLRANPAEARLFLRDLDGAGPQVDHARARVLQSFVRFLDQIVGRRPTRSFVTAGVVGGVLHVTLAWMHYGFARPVEGVVDDALRLCSVALEPEDRP